MSRVDFYILESGDESKDMAVCRLAQKAFLHGHRIYIRATDDENARRLDALLWTFNQGSFIPHAVHPANGSNEFPVLIGTDEAPEAFNDILIQLAPEPSPSFERFQRVLEIVGPDEEDKQQG